MNKIVKGDNVVVIAGKDKGSRGIVKKVVITNGKAVKVLVDGVNKITKHVKPNPNAGEAGGKVEREALLDISNVMLLDPTLNKPTRVGVKVLSDGKKVRFYKASGEMINIVRA